MYNFIEAVMSQHGAVHIVVNNAGGALSNVTVEDLAYEDLGWILGINLWEIIYGTIASCPMC